MQQLLIPNLVLLGLLGLVAATVLACILVMSRARKGRGGLQGKRSAQRGEDHSAVRTSRRAAQDIQDVVPLREMRPAPAKGGHRRQGSSPDAAKKQRPPRVEHDHDHDRVWHMLEVVRHGSDPASELAQHVPEPAEIPVLTEQVAVPAAPAPANPERIADPSSPGSKAAAALADKAMPTESTTLGSSGDAKAADNLTAAWSDEKRARLHTALENLRAGRVEQTTAEVQPRVQPRASPRDSSFGTTLSPWLAEVRERAQTESQPLMPPESQQARWYAHGEEVLVAGHAIPGLVYLGRTSPASQPEPNPALIDLELEVAAPAESIDGLDLSHPSYSSLSPEHRGAYLKWLSGRRASAAPAGFALIFFMGLEHRVFECREKPDAFRELSRLAAEMRRLVASHGKHSFSLQHHASRLAALIEIRSIREKMYLRPVPELKRTYDLPVELRVALGQAAKDGAPLPAPWALAWLLMDQTVTLRTPMTRRADEFRAQFEIRYRERFGDGLRLPDGGRSLWLSYMPISRPLDHGNSLTFQIDSAIDVDANCGVAQELRVLCGRCADELSVYTRQAGSAPQAAAALDAERTLPDASRPAQFRARN